MVAGLCMEVLGFTVLVGYLFSDTVLASKKKANK